VHRRNFVRFGSLGPSEVGSRRIDDADKQGKYTESDVGFVIVAFENLIGSDTQKSGDTGQNDHRQINLRAPNGLEFFRALVAPRQAGSFFTQVRKENFESFRPGNIVFEFGGHLFEAKFFSTQVLTVNIP
jgi:hypothetical protein